MNGTSIFKRSWRACVIVLCLCLISSVFAFADTAENIEDSSGDQDTSVEYVYIDSSDYSEQLDAIRDSVDTLVDSSRDSNPIGDIIDVTQTRETISASDANGFKQVLLSILGDYETVTTDYTYQTYNGSVSHSITTERDWAWICAAAILGSVVWCVFRGVVAILCRA